MPEKTMNSLFDDLENAVSGSRDEDAVIEDEGENNFEPIDLINDLHKYFLCNRRNNAAVLRRSELALEVLTNCVAEIKA